MIRIDRERCTSCGLCVEDCVSRVFAMENGTPRVVREENCNRCSHCLAICPRRAVIHEGLGVAAPPRVQRKLLQADVYREIVLSRRSVRRYKPEPLPRHALERLLDLARFAPTASNAQNVRYTVVTDPTLLRSVSDRIFALGDRIYRLYTRRTLLPLKRLFGSLEIVRTLDGYAENWNEYRELVRHGRDLVLHNAPALLLLHTPRTQGFGRENCLIAAAHIDAYAHAVGLGACFIGILTTAMQADRGLAPRLGIPRGHRVHAALTLGFPLVSYPYHVSRKAAQVRWVPEEEAGGGRS